MIRQVPATSCLASTAAGCDDLLPVRFSRATNSMFALLTGKLGLPVRLWLVNPDGTPKFTGKGLIPDLNEPSSGSAKNDAYRWAIRQYIDSGKCDARFAAYYIDAFWMKCSNPLQWDLHTLSNHDYFIARRAFFFDLATWGDETPVDDPGQKLGLDRQTFLQMLAALNRKAPKSMIKVGGFTPWAFKYTDHPGAGGKHGGVETEWEFARLISQFNGYMEADAIGVSSIANASFYAHYPLKERYPQPNPKPSRADWQKAGYLTAEGKVAPKLYVGYYVGDYDSPSWLYKAVAAFFSDPQRGRVPLGWAFDPNLADRAPQALVYAYRHATTNDFFIAGDSGAGYLNPRALTDRPDSKLPPALEALDGALRAVLQAMGHEHHRLHAGRLRRGLDRGGVLGLQALQPGRLRESLRPDAAGHIRRADHPGVGHAGLGGGNGRLHGTAGGGRNQRAAFPVGPDDPEVAVAGTRTCRASCARSTPTRRSWSLILTPSSA